MWLAGQDDVDFSQKLHGYWDFPARFDYQRLKDRFNHDHLGKFHHDLTSRPNPGNHGLFQGNDLQMAELFRLVRYYNLPRMIMEIEWNHHRI